MQHWGDGNSMYYIHYRIESIFMAHGSDETKIGESSGYWDGGYLNDENP